MKWQKTRNLLDSPLAMMAATIAIGCVAFPVTLHQLTLARVRESTFDAIRFAAASPEQLRALPVVGWYEGEKADAPAVRKTGWEQYQMTLPRGEASTIIDIDLRSTMLPLLLGFGGGLRIVFMIMLSGVISHFLLIRRDGWCAERVPVRMGSPYKKPASPVSVSEPEAQGNRAAEPVTALLQGAIHHLQHPAFLFDHHHQLTHWNDAAQTAIPRQTLSVGIHMLDLSAHLPWGNEMVEKMDEMVRHPALVIHKGDSLCVIPG